MNRNQTHIFATNRKRTAQTAQAFRPAVVPSCHRRGTPVCALSPRATPESRIDMGAFGGAVNRVRPQDTAFIHRLWSEFVMAVVGSARGKAELEWIAEFYSISACVCALAREYRIFPKR